MGIALRGPLLTSRLLASDNALLASLALAKLLMHLLTNWQYGYHRDELYYIAGGNHLDFGYVDHPPLAPLLARFATLLFGDSLSGLRLFPAIGGALVVLLTGLICRELGGGRFAQGFAALTVLASPLYLLENTLFQTVFLDLLAWVLLSYLVVKLLKTGNNRLWLLIGLVVGLGLEAKYTLAFFVVSLTVGLLLTPDRRLLLTRWPWIAALIALLLFLPNLLWQATNGWPSLEFLRNNNADVRADSSIIAFFLLQIPMIGPFVLPVWLAGLRYYFSSAGKPFRALAWSYIILMLLLAALGGKPYYPAPAYPMLLAAGALVIERLVRQRASRRLRPTIVATVIIGGLIPLAFFLPVLPRDLFVRSHIYEVTHDFAEMFGWKELAASVGSAYNSLPPAERAKAAILTTNYGEAGAVDMYGGAYKLPKAISAHNSYYLWGAGDANEASVYIAVGFKRERLDALFGSVTEAGLITNPEGVNNDEYRRAIYICHSPKVPFSAIWALLRHYN